MSQLGDAIQRTILFLIADTGAGHRSAANAISNAIRLISQREQEAWQAQQSQKRGSETLSSDQSSSDILIQDPATNLQPPTYRLEIVDVFEEYSHFPLREAVKLYGPTIRYNPKLYGEVYRRTNKELTVKTANYFASPLILNGLLRLFSTLQPDIVVSIHPMINNVTVRALQQLDLHIPFVTVVTDLVSVHYSWFAAGADTYIVPTEQAKQLYVRRGLDPRRVRMLGMPIDPKFTLPVDEKPVLQSKLGLKPGLPVVLLVGGGDGAGGLHASVRAISQARLPVQLMVVTGRNRRLYAQLQRTRTKLHVPTKIFGFVQNMPELMHASDVIITKAGPGTICEALACNLPLILSGYVPGQEEGNIDYVVHNDVGVLALDPSTLVDALRRLIKPGSPDLRRHLENAKRISRPAASFDIAANLLSHLPAVGEPGLWQSQHSLQMQHQMSGRLKSAIRIRRLHGSLPRPILPSKVRRRLALLGFRTRDLSTNTKRPLK